MSGNAKKADEVSEIRRTSTDHSSSIKFSVESMKQRLYMGTISRLESHDFTVGDIVFRLTVIINHVKSEDERRRILSDGLEVKEGVDVYLSLVKITEAAKISFKIALNHNISISRNFEKDLFRPESR